MSNESSINEYFMTFIVQHVDSNEENHDQQFWSNLIDRRYHYYHHQEIPIIRLIPFQHDAPSLYYTHKDYFQQLRAQLIQKNYQFISVPFNRLHYACDGQTLAEKVHEFMLRTKIYIEIANLPPFGHRNQTRHFLNIMVNQIQNLLQILHPRQLITSFQYQQMMINRRLVRLDYAFFRPEIRQDEQISFVPETISSLSYVMPVCRYLYRLLAPLYFNRVAYSTTIYKATDLIPLLENYQQEKMLQSTTMFVTIHITNHYTSITHEQLLKTLECFFHDYYVTENHVEGMTISAILELTKFILHNQYFFYKNIMYRQISGGGTGFYFIDLLINIHLFYWQRSLILCLNKQEIFVRQFNEIFFTWNESEEKLHERLTILKTDHESSISFDLNIQKRDIHYLDIEIHLIDNDRLHTRVHHDWKNEPYILPTFQNVSAILPGHIFRLALLRAVLACSQLQDFEEEQQYIEYSFLFHRFSFDFIRRHIEEFLSKFNALDLIMYPSQASYDELRRHARAYDEKQLHEKRQYIDEAQKQCIWYVYTTLKGSQLAEAKRHPNAYIPRSFIEIQNLHGVKLEIVGLPAYPRYTY